MRDMNKINKIILISILISVISFLDNVVSLSYLDTQAERKSIAIEFFVALSCFSLILQFILIFQILKKSSFIKRDSLVILGKGFLIMTIISNSILIAIIVSSIIENKSYDLTFLLISLAINFFVAMTFTSFLIFKFLSWLRLNRNLAILIYSIAFFLFLLVSTSALINILVEMMVNPNQIYLSSNPFNLHSYNKNLSIEIFEIIYILVFGLTWFATTLLLKNYFYNLHKKISKSYWIVIGLPLLFFIVTYNPVFKILSTNASEYFNIALTSYQEIIIMNISKPIGGFYFALVFIFMAKGIQNQDLKISLYFCAAGIMIFFSCMQTYTIQLTAAPPFGLVTFTALPLGSALLFFGLYLSAITISSDKDFVYSFRRAIKYGPTNLLENMGSVQWKKNLEKSVDNLIQERVSNTETPTSLTEQDIEEHLKDIIQEIARIRSEEKKGDDT